MYRDMICHRILRSHSLLGDLLGRAIEEQVTILKRIVGQPFGLARSSPLRKKEKLRELGEAAV
jgi:hypothetical protein